MGRSKSVVTIKAVLQYHKFSIESVFRLKIVNKRETSKDILLIAAADFEIIAVRDVLRAKGYEVQFLCCGIGALDALQRSTVFLCEHNLSMSSVIFIGTCGVLGDFVEPKNLAIEKSIWLPVDERLGLSYRVEGTLPPFDLPRTFNLPHATALSCQNISLNSEYNSPEKITVENLELYSVVKVFSDYLCNFSAILTTTNAVGKDAHSQWKTNFKAAGEKAASWLKEYF